MLPRILPSLAAAALVALSTAATAQIVPTPRAAEIPARGGRPFLGAATTVQPVDLAARGYVEREYRLSGHAQVYDWGADGRAVARPSRTPYATRLLVRRPSDSRRFSGLVVVEALDPTLLHDTAPVWGLTHEQILRAGHAWVGVTVVPMALAALAGHDPERYGDLSFKGGAPEGCQPHPGLPGAPHSTASPEGTEIGLAFDALAQAGALMRSGSHENPLWEFSPRFVVAAGYGDAGSLLVTYVNAVHASQRLGDDAPVFDAFLQVAGGLAEVPLNQCAPVLPPEDPRRQVGPRDVPFVSVATQSELLRTLPLRRQDSDDPADAYRRYEVAGAARFPLPPAGLPRDVDASGDLCEEPAASFPLSLAVNGVLAGLHEWLEKGTAMPRAPLLSVDGESRQFATDIHGNVIGGLRLPQVSVPLAAWSGRSTPRRVDDADSVFHCSQTGSARAYDAATLKDIHGSRAEYLRRFNLAVDQAVADRFLVPADATAVKASAAKTAPQF